MGSGAILRNLLQRGCRGCSSRTLTTSPHLSPSGHSRLSPIVSLASPPLRPLSPFPLSPLPRHSISSTAAEIDGVDQRLEGFSSLKSNRFMAHAQEFYATQTMQAWQIHEYSGSEGLVLAREKVVPSISSPRDVLIQIHAASVNPIDVQMAAGYGRNLINLYRNIVNQDIGSSEFPLTLGRDFSGVVVDVGHQVKGFERGDEVWGAIDGKRQGTHAEFCLASEKEISLKPKSLAHVEAAAIPFVAATTFASLVTVGGMSEKIARKSRILIFAGSGGIGSFAIQLMKAWGAEVVTTCPGDAIPMVQALGADRVFDYRSPSFTDELQDAGGFDVILDTLGGQTSELAIPLLKPFVGAKYVDLAWDLISDTDVHGLPVGVFKTGLGLFDKVLRAAQRGAGYCWAVFMPDAKAMRTTARLVDRGLIKPVVEATVGMERVVEAYERVAARKMRGKIVIDVAGRGDSARR